MMTTLLAHEWKRTRGMLGVTTGIALLVVAAAALLSAPGWPALSQFGVIVGVAVLSGFVPILQVLLAVDYWRSSYGSGGYFTQTLPIRGGTIFAAKLLHMSLVTFAGLVVSLLLAPIHWWGVATATGADPNPFTALRGFWEAVGESVPPLMLLGFAAAFSALLLVWVAMFAFSASIGSETPINRLGPGGPFVVFIVLYTVTQVLTFASFFVIPLGIGMTGDGLGLVRFDVFAEMASGAESSGEVMPLAFIPPLLLIGIACVWRTARSWNRKVALV